MTTDEARALESVLAGLQVEDSQGDRIFWEIHEALPHDEWFAQGG